MRKLAGAGRPEVAFVAVAVSMAAVIALAILAGCGSSGPDLAACKSAMQAQYAHALADPGAPPATRPAACKGVPDATLQKYAIEIMSTSMPGSQG